MTIMVTKIDREKIENFKKEEEDKRGDMRIGSLMKIK